MAWMSPGRTLSTPAWGMTVWHNDNWWLSWLNNMWRCASWLFRINNDRLSWRGPRVTTSRAAPTRWLHDHSGLYHWLHNRWHYTTSRYHTRYHRHTSRSHRHTSRSHRHTSRSHRHTSRSHGHTSRSHRHTRVTRRCHGDTRRCHRHTRASRATPTRWRNDHVGWRCLMHNWRHRSTWYHRHTRRCHTHRRTRGYHSYGRHRHLRFMSHSCITHWRMKRGPHWHWRGLNNWWLWRRR